MAKRSRRNPKNESLDRTESAPSPDWRKAGESEVMKAVEQHDAEVPDEANDSPSDRDAERRIADAVSEVQEELARQAPADEPKSAAAPVVPLRVFVQVSGRKWDQIAGFKSHAKRLNVGPMSIPDWRQALADFMGKPTK